MWSVCVFPSLGTKEAAGPVDVHAAAAGQAWTDVRVGLKTLPVLHGAKHTML